MELGKQAKGGIARAKSLTADQRSEIARKAGHARWGVEQASHEGVFSIGDLDFTAAVVSGKRLLSLRTLHRALGMSKQSGGRDSSAGALPPFLQAEGLKPFISEIVSMPAAPVQYVTKSGLVAHGYPAELLPKICEVFLKFRDAHILAGKSVPRQYAHIINRCDVLIRGLATVGIMALVDEATGYQEVRDRQALQAILDKYLAKEHAAWAKCFPDDFYKHIFRLRGWQMKDLQKGTKPQCVAYFTKDLVYNRLAPGILRELEARNPVRESGRRKTKHHQWLSGDVGHPALANHFLALLAIMRIADNWDQLMGFVNRALPVQGDFIQLPLFPELEAAMQ